MTGFLGLYLLDELLRRTNAEIFCLIRCVSEEEVSTRITQLNISKKKKKRSGPSEENVPKKENSQDDTVPGEEAAGAGGRGARP